jgi:hypothetical protein
VTEAALAGGFPYKEDQQNATRNVALANEQITDNPADNDSSSDHYSLDYEPNEDVREEQSKLSLINV